MPGSKAGTRGRVLKIHTVSEPKNQKQPARHVQNLSFRKPLFAFCRKKGFRTPREFFCNSFLNSDLPDQLTVAAIPQEYRDLFNGRVNLIETAAFVNLSVAHIRPGRARRKVYAS